MYRMQNDACVKECPSGYYASIKGWQTKFILPVNLIMRS